MSPVTRHPSLLTFLAVLLLFSCTNTEQQYKTIDGFALGTTYHIIYRDVEGRNFQPVVDSLLADFCASLSIYDSTSIISRVNKNQELEVDDYFIEVFNRSKNIYNESGGVFDISASPLFNAWGFGFKHKEKITPKAIDSLKKIIGMHKINLHGRHILKDDPRMNLSANAIAKGYSVDITARWLAAQDITDYLVEIGGEIICAGKNKKGEEWSVAIDRPEDGNMIAGESVQAIVHFTNRAMATSGNYRKYYIEDGKKYAHTIDPRTGYPVTHNLLSATIFAADCMTADAYATVLLVEGLEKSKEILQQHPELGAYLIYEEDGVMKDYATPDVQKMVKR